MWNAFDVRKWRHVHDRHAGNPRSRDGIKQLTDTRGSILRLLHCQSNQIKLDWVDFVRLARGDSPRQFSRVDFNRFLTAPDRYTHSKTFGIDQLSFRGQTDKRYVVTRGQEFGRQQRPIRGAKNENNA